MSEKDNGELAFPIGSGDMRDPTGMTLSDYFAAKAMQGFNANPDCTDLTGEIIATWSYSMADNMLEERKKLK